MSIEVKKAPPFIEVKGSYADDDTGSVNILFLAGDNEFYAVEIKNSIIEALVVAILAKAKDLRSSRPELQEAARQALVVKNMGAAMSPAGDLAWKITLDGGLEVSLLFQPKEFDELFRQMDEVRDLVHRKMH